MKDLGEAKKILGMELTCKREKGFVHLTQNQYLSKVLQRFSVNDATKYVSTLLALHFKLSTLLSPKVDEVKFQMKNVPYSNLVGSLMYAIMRSRPYIAMLLVW